MAENAFIGKETEPTDAELTDALGPSKAVWEQLLTELAGEHGLDIREWKCHSPQWGWSLRVKLKKRTIDLFGPGHYMAAKPVCPSGGIYTLGAVQENPRCTIPGHTYPY
jgi:hypothetical protein